MLRPLDGTTVISLEHAIAAPFCTRQLADLGARVIKIERPGSGDFARNYDERVRGLSSHFVWCNRSKESLTLDIKHPQGRAILIKLLEISDVLVQNLAPGAAARAGLDYDTLHDKYPTLIVCDISGYGANGPYCEKKAYDLLIQNESGFVSITGSPEEPAKAGNSIADISGGMYAYSNILAALLLRSKTGQGCHIEVSLFESMVEWMTYPLYYAFEGAPPPPRTGGAHATICPYGPYPTSNGKTIILGLQNEREWEMFCTKVLELPELARDPRFSSNPKRSAAREELNAIIFDTFSKSTADQVIERLENAQIASARMNDMHELWLHPQLKARGRWVEIDTPAGRIPALLPPGSPAGFKPRMDRVPALGEHSRSILEELGYDAAAIERLYSRRVI